MTEAELVDRLLALPDIPTRRRFLKQHKLFLNDEVARLLELRATHFLRSDIHLSLELVNHLYYMAELTHNSLYKGWGRVLEADARSIGLGEYELAVTLYD